jgi:hypothetical protein
MHKAYVAGAGIMGAAVVAAAAFAVLVFAGLFAVSPGVGRGHRAKALEQQPSSTTTPPSSPSTTTGPPPPGTAAETGALSDPVIRWLGALGDRDRRYGWLRTPLAAACSGTSRLL